MMKSNIPHVLQYNSDFTGCGYWRLLWPQLLLNMKQKASVINTQFFSRDYLQYSLLNVVHIQRQGAPHQLEFFEKLSQLKERMQFRLVYDVDDVLFYEDIPDFNEVKVKHADPEIRNATQKIIELCDEVTTTTPVLRDYYLKKTSQDKISVIPNYPPLFWLGDLYSEEMLLHNYRKNKDRPRILYAGGGSHFDKRKNKGNEQDDFSHIREAIEKHAKDFKWIFVGGVPLYLEQLVYAGDVEIYPFQSIDTFPRMLSLLGASMMIAPLADNIFNRAKSDIKHVEASALGLPIACQDICTYEYAPIRFNTGEEMIDRIKDTLKDEKSFITASRQARHFVESRWLDRPENYGKYLDVYQYPYGDPRRNYLRNTM